MVRNASAGTGAMSADRVDGLAAVVDAIRSAAGVTKPELVHRVGLGRSVVGQRVAELEAVGLVVAAGLGPSTGGRAPRRLRLRAEAGLVAGVDCGATGMVVGIADLSGQILARVDERIDIAEGPDTVLSRVEELIDQLRARIPHPAPIWGVGVGVPGPVEFATGLPVAPPIMPGWDAYPIRDRFARRYAAPVWVDNDVNLLALGEMRSRSGPAAADDLLFVKIGTGIGAGLVSGGRLHRGTNGCAGDIGHVAVSTAGDVVCRCGNVGCLEAVAGGGALARDVRRLAESGQSPIVAEMLALSGDITPADVIVAAERGDPAARMALARAGRLVGETLATLVSFFNPGLVVLGGAVAGAGDHVLAAIREAVYRRSLPLATRTLRIELSALREEAGLTGAVHLVLDSLFEPQRLSVWLPFSSPAGRPEVATAPAGAAA